MGTIWVREFTGGLDTRRLPETSSGGTLVKGEDGHITSGGEFEKRAKFDLAYTLPAGTIGLAHDNSGLYVFGSPAAPAGLPAGISYQQLVHTDGTTALSKLRSFDIYSGLIYAAGEFANGDILHFYDATRVTSWADGKARVSFDVTGGSVGTDSIALHIDTPTSQVAVTAYWGTSNTSAAAAVATGINSSGVITATSSGATVTIIAGAAGSDYNGLGVTWTLSGAYAIGPAFGASGTLTELKFADGSDSPDTPGAFVKTIRSQIHSVSGPTAHFTGLDQPTVWTTDAAGAGFIDMSRYAQGANALYAIETYQGWLAYFAARAIQVWLIDSDPTNDAIQQVLANTGTTCPRSVAKFGDNDLFYLDESGVRSLRARDASNAAATTDLGSPVDALVSAKLRVLSTIERQKVVGLVNPVDKRFWLVFPDQIFVFSFFEGTKVSAWTIYNPTYYDGSGTLTSFTIDDVTVYDNRIYLRSGDNIFVYGGLETGLAQDATQAVGWLPFLDGGEPTVEKAWDSFDAAIRGEWKIDVAMRPTEAGLTVSETVATINETTYGNENIGMVGRSTHISLRFTSQGEGAAVLSACAVHYTPAADK